MHHFSSGKTIHHSLLRIALVDNMGHFLFSTILTFLFLTFRRATVKKGVTFRTATPSNSLLWDITLDMGADGAIAVVCQRKAPIPGKRQVCSHYSECHCIASMCSILLSLGNLSHIYWFKLLLFGWVNNTAEVQRECSWIVGCQRL